jgi:hypothetical protein
MDLWMGGFLGDAAAAFCKNPFIHLSNHPFCIFRLWLASRIKTKTHDCCQPWVLVKFSFSTSTNGVADYNDGQNDNL